jgi:hypothetical protein
MTDFATSGYVTLAQAVDRIGQRLMPHEWLGHEVDLLTWDSRATEEPAAVIEGAAITGTQAGRLNRALNHLLQTLRAGDVKAFVAHEDGEVRAFPPSLWARPGIRAVFRSGGLPVEFRVALEGHKAGAGKRWILISDPGLRSVLERIAARQALSDVGPELRAWLATKVDEASAKEPPVKKRIWLKAQGTFGSRLSYRTFDRVWRETVPATCRRPVRARPAKPAE